MLAKFSERLVIGPGAFRLLLAFLVFASHVSRANTGRLGVILFFVLSGYWIARIWREQYENATIGWFYLGRYLRLMPVYLAIVGVCWLFLGGSLWPNLLLLGIATTGGDLIGVSWSLDIELQFYILLPLLLMTLPVISRGVMAVSLLVGAVGWYLFAELGIASVLQYLPAFLIGGMIYETRWRPGCNAAVLSAAAFVVFTLAAALSPLGWILDNRVTEPWQSDLFSFVWLIPLIPYVAASLKIRSSNLDRHLGNYTYPFYLVHYPVVYVILNEFGKTPLIKIATLAASIIIGLAFYMLVDRPAESLRHRLIEGRRKRMSETPPAAPATLSKAPPGA